MSRHGQSLRNLSRDDLQVVLGLLVTEGIGVRTLHRILSSESVIKEGLSVLLRSTREELALQQRLSMELVERFWENEIKSRHLHEELEESNVEILVEGTTSYPVWLSRMPQNKRPPVLFAQGNLGILAKQSVGFCGSRKASERALEVTAQCSAELTRSGINVVAGYAHGVDLAAHRSALEAGGTTTLVLAEGIMQFRMKSALKDVATLDNTLIISEFLPRISWLARNAMRRNYTISGLSVAMILVESGTNGGTFEAGKAALEIGCPLFVVDYSDPSVSAPGNPHFLDRGATPLRRKKSGEPNLNKVLSTVAATRKNCQEGKMGQDDLFNAGV